MSTSDADPPPAAEPPEEGRVDDVADDGMAPLVNNTGVDAGEGDDADASSG